MERKIGEIFTYNGKTYQVVKSSSCNGCAFRGRVCSIHKSYTGPCTSNIRFDKTSVIFKEIKNMERKVGEIFTYDGKTYKVVPGYGCENCDFKDLRCNMRTFSEVRGACDSSMRKDNNNVIFKEVKKHIDIKNNQLTIDIPEGMEIDLENSDLAKGIVKFKKKDITYDDILQSYATDFGGIRVPNHCIDKILAISKLMNIAKYYNGNWKPDWNNIDKYKYYIIYNGSDNTYAVDYNSIYTYSNSAMGILDNMPESSQLSLF